jgi:hypothetical protein
VHYIVPRCVASICAKDRLGMGGVLPSDDTDSICYWRHLYDMPLARVVAGVGIFDTTDPDRCFYWVFDDSPLLACMLSLLQLPSVVPIRLLTSFMWRTLCSFLLNSRLCQYNARFSERPARGRLVSCRWQAASRKQATGENQQRQPRAESNGGYVFAGGPTRL